MKPPLSTFGDLRGFAHGEATPRRWRYLCESLEQWPDLTQLHEVILPYLTGALERWPDAIRVAPTRWLDRLLAGDEVPALVVARKLVFQGKWLGQEGMTRLALAPELEHVREVHLHGSAIGPEALRALGESSSWLYDVHALHIHHNAIGAAGAEALAQAAALNNLKILELAYADLPAAAITTLGEAAFAPRLHTLTLRHNPLGAAGARHIAQGPWSELITLDVTSCEFGPEGMTALTEPKTLGQLRTLKLTSNWIGDEGLSTLATSDLLAPLHHLTLAYNNLTTQGIELFTLASALKGLRTLELYGNKLDDDAARALARTPHLSDLQKLRLELNDISEDGFWSLRASSHLSEPVRHSFRTPQDPSAST